MIHMFRANRLALCGDHLPDEQLTEDFAAVSCPACISVLSVIADSFEWNREPKLVWIHAFLKHVQSCSTCVRAKYRQQRIDRERPVQADYLSRNCRHAHALYAQITAGMDYDTEGIISA